MPPAAGALDFVPWVCSDVQDFTDELIELSEATDVESFVTLARESGLPPKLCAAIQADSHYPKATKAGLKRAVAAVSVKWLNKSGVSAKNKEEVTLLFMFVSLRLNRRRLRKDVETMIEEHKSKSDAKPDAKPPAQKADAENPPLAIVK